MPLAHARRFIIRVASDPDLRDRLYRARGPEERQTELAAMGLEFTEQDFDQAMRGLEASCPSLDEHDRLVQVRIWWEMLRND